MPTFHKAFCYFKAPNSQRAIYTAYFLFPPIYIILIDWCARCSRGPEVSASSKLLLFWPISWIILLLWAKIDTLQGRFDAAESLHKCAQNISIFLF